MLEFACPNCFKTIKANDSLIGSPIVCPKCNEQVSVPSPNDEIPDAEQDWDIFDEDEKFIESSVNETGPEEYRKPADDLDPIVDNDEQEVAKEKAEERQEFIEALHRAKEFSVSGLASGMTVDEKMRQEEELQKLFDQLPEDSPAKRTGWIRDELEEKTVESEFSGAATIRVKCYVCDSVSLVTPDKQKRSIICSDCGTTLKVPESKAPEPEKLDPIKSRTPKDPQKDTEKAQKKKLLDEFFEEVPATDALDGRSGSVPSDPITPLAVDDELSDLLEAEDDDLMPLDTDQPSSTDSTNSTASKPNTRNEATPSAETVGPVEDDELSFQDEFGLMPDSNDAVASGADPVEPGSLIDEADELTLAPLTEEDLPVEPVKTTKRTESKSRSEKKSTSKTTPASEANGPLLDEGSGGLQSMDLVDEIVPETKVEGSNYTLSPVTDDPLKPVAPTAPDLEEGTEPTEKSKTQTASKNAGANSAKKKSSKKKRLVEAELYDDAPKFKPLPWAQHIFGVLADTGFWIRVAVSAVVLSIGLTFLHWTNGFMSEGTRAMELVAFFVWLPFFISMPFFWISMGAFGQRIMNTTVIGGEELGELASFAVWEWISNSLFVLIGLCAGAVPGLMLSAIVLTFTDFTGEVWLVPAFGFAFGLLLGPPFLLSSVVNGSPFQIYSKRIFDGFKANLAAWKEFYVGAVTIAVVVFGVSLFGLAGIWVLFPIGSFLLVVLLGIYYRMVGRLLGCVANEIDPVTGAKISQS